MKKFEMSANERVTMVIFGKPVHFQAVPHPNAGAPASSFMSRTAHTMESQDSKLHHIQEIDSTGQEYALKVMMKNEGSRELPRLCEFLNGLSNIPGLDCCDRICLGPEVASLTIEEYPELKFSMLMPWVKGTTWSDAQQLHPRTSQLSRWHCLHLARHLAQVLATMEGQGITHTNLSPRNVVIGPDLEAPAVELLDLDSVYCADFFLPRLSWSPMPEYRHKAEETPGPFSDRFPAALLIAEILSWYSSVIKTYFAHQSDSLFTTNELHDPQNAQYRVLCSVLETHHPALARLFERAWNSSHPREAPSLREWFESLDNVSRTKIEYAWKVPPVRSTFVNRQPRCWDHRKKETG